MLFYILMKQGEALQLCEYLVTLHHLTTGDDKCIYYTVAYCKAEYLSVFIIQWFIARLSIEFYLS